MIRFEEKIITEPGLTKLFEHFYDSIFIACNEECWKQNCSRCIGETCRWCKVIVLKARKKDADKIIFMMVFKRISIGTIAKK